MSDRAGRPEPRRGDPPAGVGLAGARRLVTWFRWRYGPPVALPTAPPRPAPPPSPPCPLLATIHGAIKAGAEAAALSDDDNLAHALRTARRARDEYVLLRARHARSAAVASRRMRARKRREAEQLQRAEELEEAKLLASAVSDVHTCKTKRETTRGAPQARGEPGGRAA